MRYDLFLTLLPVFVLFQSLKPTPNAKALELNNKAFKLLMVTSVRDVRTNQKILNFLDSSTNIDPKYNAAYTNKLRPLLSLRKYSLALETISKAIKNNPADASLYIKAGVIHECFLSKNKESKSNYKKAYDLILQREQKKINKTSSHHQELAYALLFYKGKSEATSYLEKVSSTCKDEKILAEIRQVKQLISKQIFDCEDKKSVFNNFTT